MRGTTPAALAGWVRGEICGSPSPLTCETYVGLSPPCAYRSRLALRFVGHIGVERISSFGAQSDATQRQLRPAERDILRFLESLTVARRGVAHFASKQTHERARIGIADMLGHGGNAQVIRYQQLLGCFDPHRLQAA